jgi:hypothetical protein
MKDPVVSMYGQYSYHTEGFIVANLEGLLALKHAINQAIAASLDGCRTTTKTELYAHDGEGYEMTIICNRTPFGVDPSWNLHSHYTAEHASTEGSNSLKYPADLIDDK